MDTEVDVAFAAGDLSPKVTDNSQKQNQRTDKSDSQVHDHRRDPSPLATPLGCLKMQMRTLTAFKKLPEIPPRASYPPSRRALDRSVVMECRSAACSMRWVTPARLPVWKWPNGRFLTKARYATGKMLKEAPIESSRKD